MKGTHAEARAFNGFLDAIKNKVHAAEREMVQDGKAVTFESFKEKWLGTNEKPFMLIEIFKQHNEQIKELVGKEYSPATYQRYVTSKAHTQSFLKWKYKLEDIDIKKLNYEFINDYAFWLKSKRRCSHNTTMKYLANFKKVVLLCIKNGWLQKDPFIGFKLTKKEVARPFLTAFELQDIASKEFKAERLTLVRDIFLFSCHTGLAYADVKKLKRSEVAVGVDGEQWIFTKRQKTDTSSRIPLLPTSLELLNKYKDHPQCINGRILPVLSNQKMNAYLKEIADTCGIDKNLTFHIARHTFATTVTLSNGVPIETVSKMLGHTNLRTTQHYAKILDVKISEDMKALRDRLRKQ
jgi:site-specific recombinase XerD